MAESIGLRTNAMSIQQDKQELRKLLEAILADLTALKNDAAGIVARENHLISAAGLTIASGKKTATAGNAFAYLAGGVVGYKAAGDMSALVGTIADAKSAGWVFYIDSAGTITTSAKTADAASAAAAFALANAIAVPTGKAVIGQLVVSTSGATFVGGTTDLDAGTATDLYLSFVGPANATTALTSTTLNLAS